MRMRDRRERLFEGDDDSRARLFGAIDGEYARCLKYARCDDATAAKMLEGGATGQTSLGDATIPKFVLYRRADAPPGR